jgi:hypothetical protein
MGCFGLAVCPLSRRVTRDPNAAVPAQILSQRFVKATAKVRVLFGELPLASNSNFSKKAFSNLQYFPGLPKVWVVSQFEIRCRSIGFHSCYDRGQCSETGHARSLQEENRMNALEQLLRFLAGLQDAKIRYTLDSVRDAIMVVIPTPSSYYEVEFFSDGHIEVQTFAGSSEVKRTSFEEITQAVIQAVNGPSENSN